MELEQIGAILREDDLAAVFVPATEELPADHLDVLLEMEDFGGYVTLQIIRTNERDDENMPGLMALQFYAGLPIAVAPSQIGELLQALPVVNGAVPFGGFNYYPGEEVVYFRHIGLIPEEGEGAEEILRQSVWLSFFVLEHWGPELAAIALQELAGDRG